MMIKILDRKILQEAKRQGRRTEKSDAIKEAKARGQVCEEQHNSIEKAVRCKMARHRKVTKGIFRVKLQPYRTQ